MDRRFRSTGWLVGAIFLLAIATAASGKVIYVDDDMPADFNNIQAAIDDSNDGDTIIVTDGIYTGKGNRDIDYNGKAITIRSINPNDPYIVAATIIDCNEEGTGFNFDFDDVNCALNGLTIINSDGYSAISCYGSSPTIVNCLITNNRSRGISGHGNPIISNCIISKNSKGGIEWRDYGEPIITDCTISENTTEDRHYGYAGGGILYYNASSARMTIHNCIISGNSARDYGGGISFGGGKGGTLDITNCTITGNKAESGGGMQYEYFSGFSRVTITNCIFFDNTALKGPELYIEGQLDCHSEPSIVISYSNVYDGLTNIYVEQDCELNWDQSSIETDPCFFDTGYWDPNGTPGDANDDIWIEGDYHLKSQAGRWEPNSESWVQDDVTTSCIDAGDPMSPIGLEPFPNGGIINMGAFGGTAEASKSYFGGPICEIIVAGDVNGDCIVNFLDFRIMALHWLQDNNPPSPPYPPPPPPPPPPT